ncbi:hypothetical protein CKO28_02425 [Rhodovibrio sodomensis]|uniref:PilM protein n=1 Tax=Rhodovibrio sodomensis TaxID=1088 RepID=A0ABS1D917_9PROT|nr:hypothetical protein [Rhodovibrio sodomensis]MBK1666897.1 hypothetical protein [Rhodovibrio sodomensis]
MYTFVFLALAALIFSLGMLADGPVNDGRTMADARASAYAQSLSQFHQAATRFARSNAASVSFTPGSTLRADDTLPSGFPEDGLLSIQNWVSQRGPGGDVITYWSPASPGHDQVIARSVLEHLQDQGYRRAAGLVSASGTLVMPGSRKDAHDLPVPLPKGTLAIVSDLGQ